LDERICECFKNTICLQDAVATYEIIDVLTNRPLLDPFGLILDPEELQKMEQCAEGSQFRFPIAISTDLTQISILTTTYWVDQNGQVLEQKLDLFPWSDHTSEPLCKGLFNSYESAGHGDHSSFYRLKFSPCGRYLAVTTRRCDLNQLKMGFWNISIWSREKSHLGSQALFSWKLLTELSELYGSLLSEGTFAFNPQYMILAFVVLGGNSMIDPHSQTLIWHFGSCGALSDGTYIN
jgi:hypothetical protein